MGFEWRKLFLISWHRWNNGYDFNAFIFYIDTLILMTPLTILVSWLVLNF